MEYASGAIWTEAYGYMPRLLITTEAYSLN